MPRLTPLRRLVPALTVPLLLASLLTGCGGDDESGLSVKGSFGTLPRVSFPKGGAPDGQFKATTEVEGDGAKVADGDLIVANYVGYTWAKAGTSKLIGSSYQGTAPAAFPSWSLIPGLKKALLGAKVGSRVVAVIPPKDGYGAEGASRLNIGGQDSLVYVLDVLGTHAKNASVPSPAAFQEQGLPSVTGAAVPGLAVPRTRPPGKLTVRAIVQGQGAPVRNGQQVAIHYVGALWRNGKVFSSSWSDGKVYATVIGAGQVIKGWDEAIVGQKAGSRLLVVAPPKWAYGDPTMEVKGLPKFGIRAGDTLVYVIDVLGAY